MTPPLPGAGSPPADASRAANGQPLVLVVDDERSLRDMLRLVLKIHGFAVEVAASGEEALALYRRRLGDAPLVLLDRRMPGLSGLQTLAALRELDPGVRCCLMSGDPASHPEEELAELGVACVLTKPFSLDQVPLILRSLAAGQPPEVSLLAAGPQTPEEGFLPRGR